MRPAALGDLLTAAGASPSEPPPREAWPRLVAQLEALCRWADQAGADRASAAAASDAKSMFVANLSHELRIPLTAVIGQVDMLLLEREPLVDSQRLRLRTISSASHHLLALADDLRDLGLVERGLHKLELQPVEIHDAIADAMSALAPLAGARGVLLEPATLVAVPSVRADRVRLRQILYNLISNGVKFTRRGGSVRVRARQDGGRVAIAVTDTGIGIAAADLARLFEPFVQLAAPSDERPVGTGLGLALTRRLVELQDGSIDVASVVGSGTTITVRLPVG
jgi:signal transduction histidine kinase